MRIPTFLSLLPLALGLAAPLAADTSEEDYWRENLNFFDGIVLRCQSNSAEFLKGVCKEVATDFSFLTATANIKSIECSDCTWLEYYEKTIASGIQRPLRIDVLHATTRGEDQVGGFAQVSAIANFEDLVCATTSDCAKVSLNPDVELWMRYATFKLPYNTTHVSLVADSIEGHMKEAVTLYLKATREPN